MAVRLPFHKFDAEGGVVIRQKLTRARLLKFFGKLAPCLVGIEACGTSHHWARELIGLGHDVRFEPPLDSWTPSSLNLR